MIHIEDECQALQIIQILSKSDDIKRQLTETLSLIVSGAPGWQRYIASDIVGGRGNQKIIVTKLLRAGAEMIISGNSATFTLAAETGRVGVMRAILDFSESSLGEMDYDDWERKQNELTDLHKTPYDDLNIPQLRRVRELQRELFHVPRMKALLKAIDELQVVSVELLLDDKVDTESPDLSRSKVPIKEAHVKAILKEGMDVSRQEKAFTIIKLIIPELMKQYSFEDYQEYVNDLLRDGAEFGYMEITEYLINEGGVDINYIDSDAESIVGTPLFLAIFAENIDMMDLLIRKGADYDMVVEESNALTRIIMHHWPNNTLNHPLAIEFTRHLLAHGTGLCTCAGERVCQKINIDVTLDLADADRQTAEELANEMGEDTIKEMLRREKASRQEE